MSQEHSIIFLNIYYGPAVFWMDSKSLVCFPAVGVMHVDQVCVWYVAGRLCLCFIHCLFVGDKKWDLVLSVCYLPPLSVTSPFSSLCVLIKHKSLQSRIKNQEIFHYSFILSDLFLSRPVLSRLWAGDVAEMWISLGWLSATE